jgi:hypothetical protein
MFKIFSTHIFDEIYKIQLLEVSGAVRAICMTLVA